MQTMNDQAVRRPLTLVLDGTGATGRKVAQRLWDSGCPIRVGSRLAEPPFDLLDRRSWGPALRDVQALYLGFHPGRAASDAGRVLPELLDFAIATGVSRVVLLSRPDEVSARRAEKIIREAGIDWTIIRPAQKSRRRVPAGTIACIAADALTRVGRNERLYELDVTATAGCSRPDERLCLSVT